MHSRVEGISRNLDFEIPTGTCLKSFGIGTDRAEIMKHHSCRLPPSLLRNETPLEERELSLSFLLTIVDMRVDVEVGTLRNV